MPRAKKTEPMDKQVEQLNLSTSPVLNQKVEAKEHQEHQESGAATSAIPLSELDTENVSNEHQEHQEFRAATSAIPLSELDAENGSREAFINPKTSTKIHLIDGEKGGVGKSLFARTLMQYALDKHMKLTLVDADRTNADVSEIYPDGAITASFSEDEKKSYDADEIFNLALTQSVVVNLPAQVYLLVNEWISRNDVLEVGAQYDVRLVKWFVCTGAYDSVKLFIESLDKFKDTITHVLVKNEAMCDEWKRVLEKPELKSAIAEYKVKQVVFPKLSYRERDILLEEKLTFGAAKNYTSKLGVLGTQRVHSFLKQAHGELDKVGLLP
ncbi:MAG: cobalamin biosynthesis protein CobQ [Rhizonema sp. PD38]|nr:cobalamin biosynthesis protein CobQ [Rhizonema sp. PD38]